MRAAMARDLHGRLLRDDDVRRPRLRPMKTEVFFSRPALVDGTFWSNEEDRFELRRGEQVFQLRGLPQAVAPMVRDWLCGCVDDDAPLIAGSGPGEPWQLPVLRALDDAGLVVERSLPETRQSGVAVLSRIEQRLADFTLELERAPHATFTRALARGEASPALLRGNAIEYYFITLAAYDCLAPCLPRVSGQLQHLLATFVLDEYRHDLILKRAVTDYGISESELTDIVPLAHTSAVTNQLFYYAHTDPLSLLACLFVLEGKPAAGQNYIDLLGSNGAPAAYIDSHREHDRINTNNDHATISRQAYKLIEHVSEEDEARITQRVLMLQRLGHERDRQILEYYADASRPATRRAAALGQRGPGCGLH